MDQSGWIDAQAELQREVGNAVPFSGSALSDYLRWNALALTVEVGEALAHVSWKPWTANEPFLERDEFLGEMVDVALFLANMLVAVDCTSEEFERLVSAKQDVVRNRLTSRRYEQRRVGQ